MSSTSTALCREFLDICNALRGHESDDPGYTNLEAQVGMSYNVKKYSK
jgi:hypothetical protein